MEVVIIQKVLIAALLGSLIGLERELARKVAGMRTHAMVCLSAALLTSIAIDGLAMYSTLPAYDPSRIISNIIVGIGFIGAGTILKQGSMVIGTTTASSLWAVSAIGITVGVGLYKEAFVISGLVYGLLQVVWLIERSFLRRFRYKKITNGDIGEGEGNDKNVTE